MDEGGNTKDDLGLPKGTADAENLADQIKKDFDDGKELVVTVLKVSPCLFCYCQDCIVLPVVAASHHHICLAVWQQGVHLNAALQHVHSCVMSVVSKNSRNKGLLQNL